MDKRKRRREDCDRSLKINANTTTTTKKEAPEEDCNQFTVLAKKQKSDSKPGSGTSLLENSQTKRGQRAKRFVEGAVF